MTDNDTCERIEYNPDNADIIACIMVQIHEGVSANGFNYIEQHAIRSANANGSVKSALEQYAQQYVYEKGIKLFGERGKEAAKKEWDQLHRRQCFVPIHIASLSDIEKDRAQQAIMLLTEKRNGDIKGRAVYNGKPTREWLTQEDTTSPTASTEGVFATAVIDAHEKRDVMSLDVPNAFIQAEIPKDKGDERIVMKITGRMVDILLQIAPNIYAGYVVYENGKKVLYVEVLRALYGMLVSAMLWYNKFRGDLEEIGFDFNPYDPCIANRIV